MSDALLKCPFAKCGGEASVDGYILGPEPCRVIYSGSCSKCPCEGPPGDTPEEAARLWNTRTADAELAEALTALLSDTPHDDQFCEDATCPVRTARSALAKHSPGGA